MTLDIILTIIGIILILTGIAGCVIPVLPGPVLSWLALLMLQFGHEPPFTTKFMVMWALITAGVTVLDYIVPMWGTKKFGGTKAGVYGAGIGTVAGIFLFPPWGLIIGPFIGAILGELIAGAKEKDAVKAGFGSFLGFVAGTLMKLTIAVIMGFYFFTNAF